MHLSEYVQTHIFQAIFAPENFAIFNNNQMANTQLDEAHYKKEVTKIRLLKNAISIEINCKLQNSNIKQ